MEDYLRYTKTALNDLSQIQKIHGILGNETCDLDSVASSITYGFYLHSIQPEGGATLYLPILGIPRSEFKLKTEVCFFLSKLNLPEDVLTFRDEVDLFSLKSEAKLILTLIDHNVQSPRNELLEECVTMVIDHRALERPVSDRTVVIADTVGSCCTLVCEQLLQHPFYTMDDKTSTLLYGTILVDTINRSPQAAKTTARDEEILRELERQLPDLNGDDLFKEIFKAKFDLSELSNTEIFRKDVKTISNANMKIEMISITMQLKTLLQRENFVIDLSSFCQARHANVAVIMTLAMDGQDVERQLAVYSENRIFRQQIADLLDNFTEPSLDLDPMLTTADSLLCFTQGTVPASRKQVLPILKNFLSGEATPGLDGSGFAFDSQSSVPFKSIKDSFNAELPDEPSGIQEIVPENSDDPFGLFTSGGEASAEQVSSGSNPFTNNGGSFDDFFTTMGNANQNQATSGQSVDIEFDPFRSDSDQNKDGVKSMDDFIDDLLNLDNSASEQQSVEQTEAEETNSEPRTREETFVNAKQDLSSGQESPMDLSSGVPSGGSSYPVTPPNSFFESDMDRFAKEHNLPSFNSSEMVKIIKDRQASMEHGEAIPEEGEGDTFPYTPRNSYQDSPMDDTDRQHYDLPTFQSDEMVQRIMEKRASLGGDARDIGNPFYGNSDQFDEFNTDMPDGIGDRNENALSNLLEGSKVDSQNKTTGDNVVAKSIAEEMKNADPFATELDSESETLNRELVQNVFAENVAKAMNESSPFEETEAVKGVSNQDSQQVASDLDSESEPTLNRELVQNAVAENLDNEMKDSSPFEETEAVKGDSNQVNQQVASDFDSESETTLNRELVQNAVAENLAKEMKDSSPFEETEDIKGVSKQDSQQVASDLDSESETTLNRELVQNAVAENLDKEMKDSSPFEETEAVKGDSNQVNQQVASDFDSESETTLNRELVQNAVAENLAKEMKDSSPFEETEAIKGVSKQDSQQVASDFDSDFSSENSAMQNLAQEIQSDPQNPVALNLAQENQQSETFEIESEISAENAVAQNLFKEMQESNPFGYQSEISSQSAVAENLAEEMKKKDSFGMECDTTSQNEVTHNLEQDMQQFDLAFKKSLTDGVAFDSTFADKNLSNANNNIWNSQSSDTGSSSETKTGFSDDFNPSVLQEENVVAETIAGEILSGDSVNSPETKTGFSDDFNPSVLQEENVVAETIAGEILSGDPVNSHETKTGFSDDFNPSVLQEENGVAETIDGEITSGDPVNSPETKTGFSDDFNPSVLQEENVVAETIAGEILSGGPVNSPETKTGFFDDFNPSVLQEENVVAETIAGEMSGDPVNSPETKTGLSDDLNPSVLQEENVVAEMFAGEIKSGDSFGDQAHGNVKRELSVENVQNFLPEIERTVLTPEEVSRSPSKEFRASPGEDSSIDAMFGFEKTEGISTNAFNHNVEEMAEKIIQHNIEEESLDGLDGFPGENDSHNQDNKELSSAGELSTDLENDKENLSSELQSGFDNPVQFEQTRNKTEESFSALEGEKNVVAERIAKQIKTGEFLFETSDNSILSETGETIVDDEIDSMEATPGVRFGETKNIEAESSVLPDTSRSEELLPESNKLPVKSGVRFGTSLSLESGNESEDIMLSDDESFEEGYKGVLLSNETPADGSEVQLAQKFAEEIISEACEIVAKDEVTAALGAAPQKAIPPESSSPRGLSRSELARQMMADDDFDSEESFVAATPSSDLSPSEPDSNTQDISSKTVDMESIDKEDESGNKEVLSELMQEDRGIELLEKPSSLSEEDSEEQMERDISIEEIKTEDIPNLESAQLEVADSNTQDISSKTVDVESIDKEDESGNTEVLSELMQEDRGSELLEKHSSPSEEDSEEQTDRDISIEEIKTEDIPNLESAQLEAAKKIADTAVSEAVQQLSKDHVNIAEEIADAMVESEPDLKSSEVHEQNLVDNLTGEILFSTTNSGQLESGFGVQPVYDADVTEEDSDKSPTEFETDSFTSELIEDVAVKTETNVEEWDDVTKDVQSESAYLANNAINVETDMVIDTESNKSNNEPDFTDLSPDREEIVQEIAYDMADDIIQKALDTFSGDEDESSSVPSPDTSPNAEGHPFEAHMKRSHEMCPIKAEDTVETPDHDLTLSLETDYLPNFNPLRGNLGIVTSPVQTLSTDANKDLAENIGFKQMSTEQYLSSPSDESAEDLSSYNHDDMQTSVEAPSQIEDLVEEHSVEAPISVIQTEKTFSQEIEETSSVIEVSGIESSNVIDQLNSLQEEVDDSEMFVKKEVDSQSDDLKTSQDNVESHDPDDIETESPVSLADEQASKSHVASDALSAPLTGKQRKEVYMTSAGRISISTDTAAESDVDPVGSFKGFQITDMIAEESRQQTGEILARAENVMGQADEKLAKPSPLAAESDDVTDEDFLKTKSALAEAMQDVDMEDEEPEEIVSRVVPIETEVKQRQDSESSDTISKSARPTTLPPFSDHPRQKIHPNIKILAGDESDVDVDQNDDDSSLCSSDPDYISNIDDLTTPDIATPDTLIGEPDWEYRSHTREDTPVASPAAEAIPEYSASEEKQDEKSWRRVTIGDQDFTIDMKVVEPYKRVLAHGGYYGEGSAVVVFSGCYLPDRSRKDYSYVMENLFFYVISTLELLVADDYMIVYFHGATPRRQMPSFGWLKRCYQMIDRRLKKNLKSLLLVHPTLWIKTVVMMSRPFISSKFSSKLRMVKSLSELENLVPMEYVFVPDQVRHVDQCVAIDPKLLDRGFDDNQEVTKLTNTNSTRSGKKKKSSFWRKK